MTRLAVFSVALAFVMGFAFLTVDTIAKQGGIGVPGFIAIVLIVVLVVGIVGALRHPPR
jgi:heme A synthase